MVECGHWKKSFLFSLGLHGVVIFLLAGLGFPFSPPKINNTGEINIQFIHVGEESMDGNGGLAEQAQHVAAPVIGRRAAAPTTVPGHETESRERFIQPDNGAEPVPPAEKNAGAGEITGTNANSAAAAGLYTGGEAGTATQAGGQGAGKGIFGNGNFLANGDGSYTALQAEGISYTIIRDADAKYPEEARSIGYSRVVSVQAKILVGLDGYVENVEILNSVPNLGFKESALKALRSMQFDPIYYKSHNVKMYFTKKIYFQP
ncbi:TonB family protein [Sporomusa termitida]|uniref:TonB C-terminal domain-containing protein n=1 Tax=Sporomusa termitida TaxID=2377 RepID=A0A517DNJ8_9FIRM|nr:TonB family protein [Sporomusa termitida]QDR78941.1 hypothetical protein SPTER_01920 [Sporomusa termitida]